MFAAGLGTKAEPTLPPGSGWQRLRTPLVPMSPTPHLGGGKLQVALALAQRRVERLAARRQRLAQQRAAVERETVEGKHADGDLRQRLGALKHERARVSGAAAQAAARQDTVESPRAFFSKVKVFELQATRSP